MNTIATLLLHTLTVHFRRTAHEPTAAELAARLGYSASYVNYGLSILQARGYVSRSTRGRVALTRREG